MRANAASTLLAGWCAVGVPWGVVCAWQRRYLGVSDIVKTLVVVLLSLSFVAGVQWIGRLMEWLP